MRADTTPLPPQGFRGRLRARLRGMVRGWVEGPQVLHFDDADPRLSLDQPTWAPFRSVLTRPGEGGAVHVGRYSAINYSATLMPAGQHHVEWVSAGHGHVEDGEWTGPDDAIHARGPIEIGSDVLVGFEALVLSGVTLGHGAVVGARAVVTRSVEPYSIVLGNPAVHVRYRFEEPVREALLRIRWWDWTEDEVAAHADQIHGPEVETFVAQHDPDVGPPSCPVCGPHGGPARLPQAPSTTS